MIQEKNISGQREEESGINIILGGKNTWEAPRTVRRECYNDFELVSLHSPSYVLSRLASLYQFPAIAFHLLSFVFFYFDVGFSEVVLLPLFLPLGCFLFGSSPLLGNELLSNKTMGSKTGESDSFVVTLLSQMASEAGVGFFGIPEAVNKLFS
ncbi:hypothetical protein NC651_029147 [Populus alba x Populus x berolinensis]|nr:hypothetical protein NC651_029147 [Populus alba x Populus x berolinensis]